jgi:metallo-beta-lactamase family protein
MSKKSKDKIRVSFVGGNAEDVTGSMTLIEFSGHKILLECGLYQSESLMNDYKVNNRKLPFKPSEIEYVFVGHNHADHMLLLPRLYTQGCKAKIIAPKNVEQLFEIMALDSAFIMQRDTETIERRYNKCVNPIYTEDAVSATLPYFQEYDYNEKFELDDNISFQFIPSGHIINGAQIELWIKNNNHITKIGYTSDIGNTVIPKYYVTPFQPIEKCNLLIGESTYADNSRSVTMKDREKDLEKIHSIIDTVCCDNKHKVLIPVFALDRTQNILTILYKMFGSDESFDIPIILDSPLACKITRLYEKLITNENDLELYHQVMNWKNLKLVEEYDDSKFYQQSKEPMIVCACSGWMSAGRSRTWAKRLLPDAQSHIIFVGYSSEGSLSYKIKKGKVTKTISIDGKAYANRCNVTDLKSFSSHMQFNELLDYYSNVQCEKVCLVHGEKKAKENFSKELQNEISKKNKCGKVICVNSSTSILL